jgi:hypothetical protein
MARSRAAGLPVAKPHRGCKAVAPTKESVPDRV